MGTGHPDGPRYDYLLPLRARTVRRLENQVGFDEKGRLRLSAMVHEYLAWKEQERPFEPAAVAEPAPAPRTEARPVHG